MSPLLIDRSPDLKRLRDEGYDIDIVEGYLLVRDVPYVTSKREIKRGVLISTLMLANDVTVAPDTHVAMLAGEYPCHSDGSLIERIRHAEINTNVGSIVANYSFSAKPTPSGRYETYYDKMSTYADILSGPARALDPNATAQTFPVIQNQSDDGVFNYIDTASSRAEINAVTKKLALNSVAIVGLGGTGSYVLDLVAKTPVREIHLFDGDIFLQHNAFRSPGAPSGDELAQRFSKVDYFHGIYSKMRRGIVPHNCYLTPETMSTLVNVDFVFLCMEGQAKKAIVAKLEEQDVPFIDVGMGVYLSGDSLGGLVRTTTSIRGKRSHIWEKHRIPFSEGGDRNEYDRNIQIADLNALNAALAVIKWKKIFGFYIDQERELFSTYAIGGNDLDNEDAA
jgi:hypothetical protein